MNRIQFTCLAACVVALANPCLCGAEQAADSAGKGADQAEASPADALSDAAPQSPSIAPGGPPIFVPPIEVPPAPVEAPDEAIMLTEMSVEGKVEKGSAVDLKNERKRASIAIDYISIDQMLKLAAGDLSEVVFRMPGISVADGQFAVVRGLSDRFVSTTLNGVKLPSPDPEKQAVQLDLVPSSVVEAVVVAKSFEASQWADSSGGNMDIMTRTLPEQDFVKVGVGLKFNSNALRGGPDYAIRGSVRERLGFGSKSRLPAGSSDLTWQYVPKKRDQFPIGNKLSLEFSKTFTQQRLGLFASIVTEADYSSREGVRMTRQALFGAAPRPATPRTPAFPGRPSGFETEPHFGDVPASAYGYEESESQNTLGGTAVLGWKISPESEIRLSALFVQMGVDQAVISESLWSVDPETGSKTMVGLPPTLNDSRDANTFFDTFEYFRERNLTVIQLAGEHTVDVFGGLDISWVAQHASTYQKDHPFIEARFKSPFADLYETFSVTVGSDEVTPLLRTWSRNEETSHAARLDMKLPFQISDREGSSLQFGVAFDSSQRDVEGTVMAARALGGGTSTGPDPAALISPFAAFSDSFVNRSSVSREIGAGYLSASVALFPKLKWVGGARFEKLAYSISGGARWGSNFFTTESIYTEGIGGFGRILGTRATGNPAFESKKWYPGVGLVFEPAKSFTLRANYSITNGRPSFRELGPFFNKSIESGNLVLGNPALKPSEVTNLDLRLDWNPSQRDLASVSLFEKKVRSPIEKLIFDTRSAASELTEIWVNNPNEAQLKGIEVEFRHALDRWAGWLDGVTIGGNFTWIDARVDEHPQVVLDAKPFFKDPDRITTSRRLYDQPEFIGNLDLTWARPESGTSVTLAAYSISDVLTVTGLSAFMFDTYERAYTRLDLAFTQNLGRRTKVKVVIKNLADPVRGTLYDRDALAYEEVRNQYRLGRTFNVSLTSDF